MQETVAQLGELDAAGRARAQELACRITGRGRQQELFEERPTPEETVPVRLDRVRVERTRSFGDVYLGWTLWRGLGLDRFCSELMPEGREGVSWATMAEILVLARLCEPSSELHIAESWYSRTALDDLLGVREDLVNDDRLYRALDRLVPHKEALEKHLRGRLGELFDLDYDLLLYDVTSTYFEGQANGNRVDVTTVEEIVGSMEARFGLAKRVWVMDRGWSARRTSRGSSGRVGAMSWGPRARS
jgi:hypothetical protein